jgi:hypothetical protein
VSLTVWSCSCYIVCYCFLFILFMSLPVQGRYVVTHLFSSTSSLFILFFSRSHFLIIVSTLLFWVLFFLFACLERWSFIPVHFWCWSDHCLYFFTQILPECIFLGERKCYLKLWSCCTIPFFSAFVPAFSPLLVFVVTSEPFGSSFFFRGFWLTCRFDLP